MKRLVKTFYFIFAFLVACLIILKSLEYFHPDFDHGFLMNKKEVFEHWYKYALYLHIVTAPITIFAGILQFSLNAKNKFHRISGYVYVTAVLFAATGGFFMALKSIGGTLSSISFIALDILWVTFTIKAFLLAKDGNISAHKVYMTRSFILANSAILLRLFSFVSNYYLHANPVMAYVVISWLSWLPALLLYEWWLRASD